MSGTQTLKHFNKTGFRPVFWTSESMQKRRNNLVEVKFVWQIQDPLQMAHIQTAILSKNDFLVKKGENGQTKIALDAKLASLSRKGFFGV